MVHGDPREGKWRGKWKMEWVASSLHTTSEHGLSSITTADAHTSAASSRLNWCSHRFKCTHFTKRQNLVSAHVPSHFKCSLRPHQVYSFLEPHAHTPTRPISLKLHFNILLPSIPRSPTVSLPHRFLIRTFYNVLNSTLWATWTTHLSSLHLTIIIKNFIIVIVKIV